MSRFVVLDQADVLLSGGRHADALAVLGPHLATHPDDDRALCLAARAHLGRHENVAALAAARAAHRLAPGEWPLRLISLAEAALGHWQPAVAAADEAVRMAPFTYQTHLQAAQARLSGSNQLDVALRACNEAAKLAPDEPAVHRVAGAVLARQGRHGAARDAFRRALALDPTDAVARHELARMDLKFGRLSRAADGFRSAIALDPGLQVGVRNLDLVVGRLLQLVSIIVAVGMFASGVVIENGGLPRWVVPALATTTVVAVVARFLRHTGPPMRAYLRALPRRRHSVAAYVGVVLAAVVLMWVSAAVGIVVTWWIGFAIVFAGRVLNILGSNQVRGGGRS